MFEDFDFSILDNPEFKEDSVREEIVIPILKKLGYSATGTNKIIRSRNLTHPFVYIGTSQRRINIIPDYLLTIEDKNAFILDAKSPNEDIRKGKNVEQAYSYSIHQDIRTPKYALCNGREISIFEISRHEPIEIIEISDIEKKWSIIEKHLSPLGFLKPYIFEFQTDLGLSLLKMGFSPATNWHFISIFVNTIIKAEDNLYTICTVVKFHNDIYAASFDFDRTQYLDFLEKITKEQKELISKGLSRMPYMIDLSELEIWVSIHAKLSLKVESNEAEDYMPFRLIEFSIQDK